jgi:hypothetical protein
MKHYNLKITIERTPRNLNSFSLEVKIWVTLLRDLDLRRQSQGTKANVVAHFSATQTHATSTLSTARKLVLTDPCNGMSTGSARSHPLPSVAKGQNINVKWNNIHISAPVVPGLWFAIPLNGRGGGGGGIFRVPKKKY